jgi:hypothetical protein
MNPLLLVTFATIMADLLDSRFLLEKPSSSSIKIIETPMGMVVRDTLTDHNQHASASGGASFPCVRALTLLHMLLGHSSRPPPVPHSPRRP